MATTSRTVFQVALLLLFTMISVGCVSPTYLAERRAKEEAQAIETLRSEYRLPEPPSFDLKVRKAKPSAPGSFYFVVREPGWEADSPIESADIKTERNPSGTVFTWELPAERVVEHWSEKKTQPLLLHLWKGPEHRYVILPCFESEWSGSDWALVVFGGGFLAFTAPLWLPSWLIITPFEKSRIAKESGYIATPQPGKDAPECYPNVDAKFSAHLDTDPLGKPRLIVSVVGNSWIPCEGTALDSMRKAIGCFQPNLSAGITEDPVLPNTFIVPLSTNLPDKSRPILLLHRDCTSGQPGGASLWAFYASSKGDWVKAWRIFQGEVLSHSKRAEDPKKEPAQ